MAAIITESGRIRSSDTWSLSTQDGGYVYLHSNGYVGVGVETPGKELTVSGDVSASGRVFIDTVDTTAVAGPNVLILNGDEVEQKSINSLVWDTGATFLSGNGEANHIAIWGETSYLSADSGDLYWDAAGQFMGIGTNVPAHCIDIVTQDNTDNYIRMTNAAAETIFRLGLENTDQSYLRMYDDNTERIHLHSAGSSWISGGSFGINTNSPAELLHVDGDTRIDGILDINGYSESNPVKYQTYRIPASGTGLGRMETMLRLQLVTDSSVTEGTIYFYGGWNHANMIGLNVLDFGYHTTGTALNSAVTYTRMHQNFGQATNARFLDITEENGYVSLPIQVNNSVDFTVLIQYRETGAGSLDNVTHTTWLTTTDAWAYRPPEYRNGFFINGTLRSRRSESTVYSSSTTTLSGNTNALFRNYRSSEATGLQTQLRFEVDGGTYDREGSFGMIAESSGNGKSAFVWHTDDGSGGSETMRLNGDGQLGIGTTSPGYLLNPYVNDTATTGQLGVEQDGTGDAGMVFELTGTQSYYIGIDNSDGDIFKIGEGSAIGSNAAILMEPTHQAVGIRQSPKSGEYGFIVGASTNFSASGAMLVNSSLNSSGKGLVINSTTRTGVDNDVALLEIIDRNGDVSLHSTVEGKTSIGTTSHPATFTVAGTVSAADRVYLGTVDTTSESDPNVLVLNGAEVEQKNINSLVWDTAATFVSGGGAASHIAFWTDANTLSYDNGNLYWDSTNDMLGIRTVSPSAALHVESSDIVARFVNENSNSSDTGIQIRGARNGSVGTATAYINFDNYDDNDTNEHHLGRIYGAQATIDGSDGYIQIQGWDGSAYNVGVTVREDGKVGLGRTSPDFPVDAYHASDNVIARFHSGDNRAWVCIKDDEPATYGTMLGMDSDLGYLLMVADDSVNIKLTLKDSGMLGIGTTTPEGIVHAVSATSGGLGAQLVLDNPASSTLGNQVELAFLTDSGTSGNATRNGRIIAENENAGNGAANMQFWTWDGSADEERVRISSSGVVGINNTAPEDYTLTESDLVVGNTTDNAGLTIRSGSNRFGGLFFADGTSSTEQYRGYVQYNHDYAGYEDQMFFGTAGTTQMVITSTGKVGIGTTNPLELLYIKSTGDDARITLDAAASYDPEIKFYVNGSVYRTIGFDTGTSSFRIGTDNVDTGVHFTVLSTGNVGIGTTDPSLDLEVNGVTYTTSYFIAGTHDSSAGVMNTIAYRFNEGRGWGYNEIDDRVYYNGAGGNIPFWVDTSAAKFDVDLTVTGNLSVLGNVTYLDTDVSVTSALSVTNTGSGVALLVNQTGSEPILDFQDDGTSVFYIEDGGYVGLGTTNPVERLTVTGNISASGRLYLDTVDTTGVSDPNVLVLNGDEVEQKDIDSRVWGSSLVDGSGAANHIAYWIDSDTLSYDNAQLYWDASNNRLGLGTSLPLSEGGIHIQQSDANIAGVDAIADAFIIENDGSTGISIMTGPNDTGSLHFGTSADLDAGYVRYSDLFDSMTLGSASNFQFWRGGSLSVEIGDGTLGIGGITPSEALTVSGNVSTEGVMYVGRNTGYSTATPLSTTAHNALIIHTDYDSNYYFPGLVWGTKDNNGSLTKAGIHVQMKGSGSKMYLSTSNDYSLGANNQGITIHEGGQVSVYADLSAAGKTYLETVDTTSVADPNVLVLNGNEVEQKNINSLVWDTDASFVSGSGIANHIAYWTDTANLSADNGALVWDPANARLGIGTDAPGYPLHLHMGDSSGVAFTTQDDFVIESSGSAGITISTPDNSSSSIAFGCASDPNGAFLSYNYDNALFQLGTIETGHEIAIYSGNLVQAMYIDSSQNIGVGTGTPAEKLDIVGTGQVGVRIAGTNGTIPSSYSQDDSAILYHMRSGNTGDRVLDIVNSGSTFSQSSIRFFTQNDNGSTAQERMNIGPVGHLNIGNYSNGLSAKGSVIGAISSVETSYADVVPSVGDCFLSLQNYPSAEAANDMAMIQFGINGGTYNRVGSIGMITESASNRRSALVFNVDDGSTRPEAMRITSNGYVGIGTTAASHELEILNSGDVTLVLGSSDAGGSTLILDGDANGDATGGDYAIIRHDTGGTLLFSNDGTAGDMEFQVAGSNAMRINNDKTVSIGRFSGTWALDVYSTNSTAASGHAVRVLHDDDGSEGPVIRLQHDSASPAASDIIGEIDFVGNDTSLTARVAGNIRAVARTINAGSVDADLVFSAYRSNTQYEVLHVTHDERVGIGTDSPSNTVDILGSANSDILMVRASGNRLVALGADATPDGQIRMFNSSDSQTVDIRADANDSYLNGGGNLGIGITNPAVKLQVTGSMAVSGTGGIGATTYRGASGSAVVLYPGGGQFSDRGNVNYSSSKYLKIALPVTWNDAMLQFWVDVYQYNTGQSKSYCIAGYLYSGGSSWLNCSAWALGDVSTVGTTVHFGHDGSKACVYIEDKAGWGVFGPHIVVRDFHAGFSSQNITNWIDGWELTFTTNLSSISQTRECALQVKGGGGGTANHLAYWSDSVTLTADDDGDLYWDPANNRLGIGTTNPAYNVEVRGASPILSITSSSGNPELQFTDGTTDEYSIRYDTGLTAGLAFVEGGVGTRMVIKDGGKVGIGTTDPSEPFQIAGNGLGCASRKWHRGIENTSGAGAANGFTINLNGEHGETPDTAWRYRVILTTTGTGTDTGAVYILSYNDTSSVWQVRAVTRSSDSSNHPLLSSTGTDFVAYTNHGSSYGIHYNVESFYVSESDATFDTFGGEYHWQRLGNDLYYEDGSVGIGTDPNEALTVSGNVSASGRLYLGTVDTTGSSDPNVLVLNGDEVEQKDINDKVWGGSLVDGAGVASHIAYWSDTDTLTYDNNQLYWDATNNRMGIGTNSPSNEMEIYGTHPALRLADSGGAYATLSSTVAGGLVIEADPSNVGSDTRIIFETDGTEAVRIDDNQHVGIGLTEDPKDVFQVAGAATNYLLFCSAGPDRVGIGTSQPSYKLEVNGTCHIVSDFTVGGSKSFLIDHPMKDGWYLQYTCLEGPEAAVYVRGTSSSRIIELPDYWEELVDEDSITVNLTPRGRFQTLYIEKVKDNKIKVGGFEAGNKYDYIVHAKRKDIEQHDVEFPKPDHK